MTKKIVVMICGLALWFNSGITQINRPYEPMVLTGDTLAQFSNYEIKYLYLYAYDANTDSWRMIPFQIDEVNPDVEDSLKYFVPEDSLGGILDANDELVFILGDLGDKADSTKWLKDTDSTRYEICFIDSLDNQRGYVYLYFSKTITEQIPNIYAMAYDSLNDHVNSANYQLGFNSTGQLGDVIINSKIGGSGKDLFDRLKIRAIGSFWILPVFLYEGNIEMFYAYAKSGPVRVIRNMYGHFVAEQLNVDEDFTQTSFFYPWNGTFKLVEIPIGNVVDIGAQVDVIRVSWDFNRNATGMKFFSEKHRAGAVVDGDSTNDNMDYTCFPRELNWTMGTGEQGTMLNVFYVPPLGDIIRIYYHEATDGSTGDQSGIRIDSGDDSSFADNGFSLEKNIENYASKDSTFSVLYYNFFLPPNFDPDDASKICEQLKAPLSYYTRIQKKYTPPSDVARYDGSVPDEFLLLQNYPNPFNATTTISFSLPKRTHISLRIFDTLGRLMYTLVDQNLSQGFYQFKWNGLNNEGIFVPSGVYFYKLESPEFNFTRKLLLIK